MTLPPRPEFEYGGRLLTAEPFNVPLNLLAVDLLDGRTKFVRLEPGDGSRYDLILVPVWGLNGMLHGDDAEPGKWLYITKLERSSGMLSKSKLIARSCWQGEWSEFTSNEYVQNLLHWWHMCLQLEMGYVHYELEASAKRSTEDSTDVLKLGSNMLAIDMDKISMGRLHSIIDSAVGDDEQTFDHTPDSDAIKAAFDEDDCPPEFLT